MNVKYNYQHIVYIYCCALKYERRFHTDYFLLLISYFILERMWIHCFTETYVNLWKYQINIHSVTTCWSHCLTATYIWNLCYSNVLWDCENYNFSVGLCSCWPGDLKKIPSIILWKGHNKYGESTLLLLEYIGRAWKTIQMTAKYINKDNW